MSAFREDPDGAQPCALCKELLADVPREGVWLLLAISTFMLFSTVMSTIALASSKSLIKTPDRLEQYHCCYHELYGAEALATICNPGALITNINKTGAAHC